MESGPPGLWAFRLLVHCPKNNLNLARGFQGWSRCNGICRGFVYKYLAQKPDILYTVASAPTVRGSVFMQEFRLFMGQCGWQVKLRKFRQKNCTTKMEMKVFPTWVFTIEKDPFTNVLKPHWPNIFWNLCIKTDPVTDVADATVYVRFLCLCMYCISSTEIRHSPLPRLKPWQEVRKSDYFGTVCKNCFCLVQH